jgi:hypothetical protein
LLFGELEADAHEQHADRHPEQHPGERTAEQRFRDYRQQDEQIARKEEISRNAKPHGARVPGTGLDGAWKHLEGPDPAPA